MVDKTQIAAINIDASGAAKGAQEVARAKDTIKQASRGLEVVSDQVRKALDAEAKQLERLRRQIDPTYEALKRFNQGQAIINQQAKRGEIDAAEQIRLLGLLEQKYLAAAMAAGEFANSNVPQAASPIQARIDALTGVGAGADAESAKRAQQEYEAWGRELERLSARFDPLFTQTRRYEQAIDDLNEAQRLGVVTGDAFAIALAKIEAELSPASIKARELAVAEARLAAEQEKAAAESARLSAEREREARRLDDLRAKYDPLYAQTRRYLRAVEELVAAQREGAVDGRAYADALARIESELNPLSISLREAAEESERLRVEQDKSAREAERQAQRLDELRAKFDPLHAQTRRYHAALAELEEAGRSGAVTGDALARALARIEDELSPASISLREAAAEQKRLSDEQERASEQARRIALEQDRVRASYDPLFATTQRYRSALASLADAWDRGLVSQENFRRELARIESELNPVAVAQRKAAQDAAELAKEQARAAQESARQAKALSELRAKYDPLYASTERYNAALRELNELATAGALRGPALADALRRIEDQLNPASIALREAATEQERWNAAALRVVEAVDPAARAQRLYNEHVAEADELLKRQLITHDQYRQSLLRAEEALQAVERAEGRARRGRLSLNEATQLSYQINDIFAQSVAGTNPLLIMAQQGPQITQIFGGIRATLARIPPVAMATTAAFAAIAVPATIVGLRISEIATQSRRLETIARTLNPQLRGMSEQLRELTLRVSEQGIGRDEAAEVVEALGRIRSLRGELVEGVALAVPNVAAVLGQSPAEAARMLGEAFARGAEGVRELDARLGFLRPEQLRSIEALERQGDRVGALRVALRALMSDGGFENAARDMQSAWGRAIEAMSNAWDRFVERIANSDLGKGLALLIERLGNGLADLFSAPPTGGPGATAVRVDAISERISALKVELEGAQAALEMLTQQRDYGLGMLGDPVGEVTRDVERLKAEIAALEAQRAQLSAQPTDAPLIQPPPETRDERGLTDSQAKRVNTLTDALKRETEALRAQQVQRQINMAGHRAYEAALARGAEEAEARQEQILAETAARRDLAIAIADENEALDTNILRTLEVAQAYSESVASGAAADAMRQAALDSLTTGVDIASRAMRILRQEAADGLLEATRDMARMREELRGLAEVSRASALGPAAEQAARRRMDAETEFRDRIAAASASGDETMVRALEAQRAEYEKLLGLREQYNRSLQSAADMRGMRNELELLQAEWRLIGASNVARETEIALLQLRHRLVEQGYGGDELEREYEKQARILGVIVRQTDAVEQARRAYEDLRQGVKDAFGAIASSFEDAIIDGEKLSDVLRGLEKDLLRIGTRMLITDPLDRWLDSGSMWGGGSGTSGTDQILNWGGKLLGLAGGMGGADTSGVTTATAGGFGGAPVLPVTTVSLHSGGVVGSDPGTPRTVPASVLVDAPRMHRGGTAGLRSNERASILEVGEEVLTANNPRHRRNFRPASPTVVMNISTPDAASFRASSAQMTSTVARGLSIAARRNG